MQRDVDRLPDYAPMTKRSKPMRFTEDGWKAIVLSASGHACENGLHIPGNSKCVAICVVDGFQVPTLYRQEPTCVRAAGQPLDQMNLIIDVGKEWLGGAGPDNNHAVAAMQEHYHLLDAAYFAITNNQKCGRKELNGVLRNARNWLSLFDWEPLREIANTVDATLALIDAAEHME